MDDKVAARGPNLTRPIQNNHQVVVLVFLFECPVLTVEKCVTTTDPCSSCYINDA